MYLRRVRVAGFTFTLGASSCTACFHGARQGAAGTWPWCLRRWRALPLRGPPRGQQQQFLRGVCNFVLSSCFFFQKFEKRPGETSTQSPDHRNYNSVRKASSTESPRSVAAFVVNSEPHTGARPSVRMCVGLINSDGELFSCEYDTTRESVNFSESSSSIVERGTLRKIMPLRWSGFGAVSLENESGGAVGGLCVRRIALGREARAKPGVRRQGKYSRSRGDGC
jgi:hypothetical protein